MLMEWDAVACCYGARQIKDMTLTELGTHRESQSPQRPVSIAKTSSIFCIVQLLFNLQYLQHAENTGAIQGSR